MSTLARKFKWIIPSRIRRGYRKDRVDMVSSVDYVPPFDIPPLPESDKTRLIGSKRARRDSLSNTNYGIRRSLGSETPRGEYPEQLSNPFENSRAPPLPEEDETNFYN